MSRVQTDSQIGNLTQRLRIEPRELPSRVTILLREPVMALIGGRPVVTALAAQGHRWIGWLLLAGGLAAVGRIGWLSARGTRPIGRRPWGGTCSGWG